MRSPFCFDKQILSFPAVADHQAKLSIRQILVAPISSLLRKRLTVDRQYPFPEYYALRSCFRFSRTNGLFAAICPSVGHFSIFSQSAQVSNPFSRTQLCMGQSLSQDVVICKRCDSGVAGFAVQSAATDQLVCVFHRYLHKSESKQFFHIVVPFAGVWIFFKTNLPERKEHSVRSVPVSIRS